MDESLEKMSLQQKIQMLERMKKIKEAELKEREEKLKKEIEELEEKRKKDMQEIEEQFSKEEKTLDEEMIKAINELFFKERRSYTINMARVQRKLNFGVEGDLMNESSLYSIADSMFSNANMKLKESMQGSIYGSGLQESIDRSYERRSPQAEQYSLETSSYTVEELNRQDIYRGPDRDMNNYSSMQSSTLDRIDRELENRRRMG